MEINKGLRRGIMTEYNRSLNAAFRIAAAARTLSAFDPANAKAHARAFVLEQAHAVLDELDKGSGG